MPIKFDTAEEAYDMFIFSPLRFLEEYRVDVGLKKDYSGPTEAYWCLIDNDNCDPPRFLIISCPLNNDTSTYYKIRVFYVHVQIYGIGVGPYAIKPALIQTTPESKDIRLMVTAPLSGCCLMYAYDMNPERLHVAHIQPPTKKMSGKMEMSGAELQAILQKNAKFITTVQKPVLYGKNDYGDYVHAQVLGSRRVYPKNFWGLYTQLRTHTELRGAKMLGKGGQNVGANGASFAWPGHELKLPP